MIKEIKYNGLSSVPSDYECPDGDLGGMKDALVEDGSVRGLFRPRTVFTLPEGHKVIFAHATESYVHYIVQDSGVNLSWCLSDGSGSKELHTFASPVTSMNAVGNTLIAVCDDGMHYMLFKPDEQNYLYLGNSMPECPISFGLQGEMKLYSKTKDNNKEMGTFKINFDKIAEGDITKTFTDANKQKITGQVLAKVNKFIRQSIVDKGKFIYPFFVRYAYRLYDGNTLTHHSAPILMIPCTKGNPLVIWKRITGHGAYTDAELDIFTIACTLDYQPVLTAEAKERLLLWKDIIKSVDIFISAPIYTYDQNGLCESFEETENFSSFFVGRIVSGDRYQPVTVGEYLPRYYQKWDFGTILAIIDQGRCPQTTLDMPQYSKEQIAQKIKDCHAFYFVRSVPIEDLPAERTKIEIDKGYLANLVQKEVMTDDYQTHDRIIPKRTYIYNSRLNVANVKRRLFDGYDTAAMVCYANGRVIYESVRQSDGSYRESCTDLNYSYKFLAYTRMRSNGRTFTLSNACSLNLSYDAMHYLYYPDRNSDRMTLACAPGGFITCYSKKLEPHTGLNGAFYFSGFEDVSSGGSLPTPTPDPVINLPNKMYTSEVYNPFHFPLSGIKTIGTGEIYGICAAVKALSEGQWGQFPLYAFCSDGVWSLSVKSDGTFLPDQPVTLDVCINPESITQLDSSVLFASSRGIILLTGSESQCISDVLYNGTVSLDELPLLRETMVILGIDTACMEYVPFTDFIRNCRIAYDYLRQRILVFNPDSAYSYVYSMKSRTWGMTSSDLEAKINSYPLSLAMTRDNRLVDLSGDDATQVYSVMVIITRPLKLDAPDMLKSAQSIIQRGYGMNAISGILYGSRDLEHWFPVASSTDRYIRGFVGSPYKYFRLVVFASLDRKGSVYGCSFQFDIRYQEKLR